MTSSGRTARGRPNHLREVRERLGIVQQQLAVASGTTEAGLTKIEKWNHHPTQETRQKIIEALSVISGTNISEQDIWPNSTDEQDKE